MQHSKAQQDYSTTVIVDEPLPSFNSLINFTTITNSRTTTNEESRGIIWPQFISTPQNTYLSMVKGFLVPPTNKQPGGCDNNEVLPEQVIRVPGSDIRT